MATAAHCVEGMAASDMIVSCGRHDLTKYEVQEQSRGIDSVKIHHNYTITEFGGLINDMAMMKLERSLNLNGNVTTIPIADTLREEKTRPCFLVGWGKTENSSWSPVLRSAAT